jgi:hypothetical protein
MASYGILEEHTTLDPDFSILALAFCWACGLSWNEAWANVKSSLLDIPMSQDKPKITSFESFNSLSYEISYLSSWTLWSLEIDLRLFQIQSYLLLFGIALIIA